MKRWLVRLYPKRWREQYGEEFADLIAQRRIGFRDAIDIAWSALGQRLRYDEPWKIIGVPLLLAHIVLTGWNIFAPWTYETNQTLHSLRYGWLVVCFGCWTVLRDSTGAMHAGRQAATAWLLIALPWIVRGFLASTGLFAVQIVGPGDAAASGVIHYYSSYGRPPLADAYLIVPLLYSFEMWINGWLGGLLGRLILCIRSRVRAA